MSYDAMGNRTDHGYHPTTGNRYSSFRGDSASYDADGNFIQRFNPGNYTLNFYWSAEARLDSVEFQYVKLARYDYNALGKPVVKYTKSYGGSWAVSSYYIWDGAQLLLELDGSGNRRADYTYFPGTIDQPAAQSIGATTVTTTRDFRFDATGSVIGTVQGAGVSQKVAYSQWGGPDFTGNSDNHLMWKGLLYNEDVAGLIYMRGRWYDPAEGRFYNEDPIGHAGGENLYSFNDNDPINGSDPSGTMQCYDVWEVHYNSDTGAISRVDWLRSYCDGEETGGGGGLSASAASAVASKIGQTMRPFNTAVNCVGSVGFATAVSISDLKVATSLLQGGLEQLASYSLRMKAGNIALRNITGGNYATSGLLSLAVARADATATNAIHSFAHAGVEYEKGLRLTVGGIFTSREFSGWDLVPVAGALRAIAKAGQVCSGN